MACMKLEAGGTAMQLQSHALDGMSQLSHLSDQRYALEETRLSRLLYVPLIQSHALDGIWNGPSCHAQERMKRWIH